MWEYNYIYIEGVPEDELYHYGVKGMRWGVRRASKQLSKATTSESRDKAISSLNKHREKASAEVSKLKKQRVKLDDKLRKATTKNAGKASKLEQKAAKLDYKIAKNTRKAGSMFKSEERSQALMDEARVMQVKSDKLHAKANKLYAKYEQAKTKVEENERMTQAFKQGISDIDSALTEAGRRYING